MFHGLRKSNVGLKEGTKISGSTKQKYNTNLIKVCSHD